MLISHCHRRVDINEDVLQMASVSRVICIDVLVCGYKDPNEIYFYLRKVNIEIRKCLVNLLIASTYQDYFEICGLNLAKCHDTVHFVQTSKKMKNSSVEKENCTFGVSWVFIKAS